MIIIFRHRTSLLNPLNSQFPNPAIGLRRSFSFYRLSTTGNDVYFPWSSCLLSSCHFFLFCLQRCERVWIAFGVLGVVFCCFCFFASSQAERQVPSPARPVSGSQHFTLSNSLELWLFGWGGFQNIVTVISNVSLKHVVKILCQRLLRTDEELI